MTSNKNLKYKILLILGLLGFSVWLSFPLNKKIKLGLDLSGGMHLILRVDTSNLKEADRNDAVERAVEIIRSRVDQFGVAEPFIQRQGYDQIVVQLPGVTDSQRAKELVGRTALLEFKLVKDDPGALEEAASGKIPEGFDYLKDEDNKPILLSKTASLTGDAVNNSLVGMDQYGLPSVKLEFNNKGIDVFAKLTGEHINERLAIVLDGKIHSAPAIRSKIDSGEAEITRGGGFGPEEANDLRIVLRSGALPAPMVIEEERTIGALLGADSIQSGVRASLIGTALVFVFMLIYYLFSGLIACIALAFNFLIILAYMAYFGATLTLPGIAGIVLTLGMAVDANVLINERIRDELKIGKSLYAAITNGYSKAFSAIFDSNLTTLIAAFMLFQFGSGPIKGFAVTLSIGLVASMFTALYVTKTLFLLLVDFNILKSLPMLQFFKTTKIDFISKRYFCYALSLLVIGYGTFNFIKKGNEAFGIDFAGGQIQEYRFEKPIDIEQLRQELKGAGVEDAVIQESTNKTQQIDNTSKSIIIRTSLDTTEKVANIFKTKFSDNHYGLLRIEKVGPIVGKALRERAVLAMVLALIGILIYVAFRFKHFDFATAGVIALLHDVFITFGILIMLDRQIDLLVVTALLTIAGYSINDTIIIYDRVRENMVKMGRLKLSEIINTSINQTLGRTILTTVATMLVVFALFFWGGEVLNTFALTLIIGFIIGSYSTIFIVSPLVLAWNRKK